MGKDYDYVRSEIDLPRLRALNAYQQNNPPTNIGAQRLCRILETFMGIDESQPVNSESEDDDDLIEVLSNFPQGG
ncbi:hypothetical protein JZM36_06295 [Acinetobacter pittii]|uniref:hypothetical protein n=1 Tax=Acinetobacter pittii TaxID=48296 RepID=UPI0019821032|nr:hypothetical protein [Acinetobacter pittii]MBN6516480.1 hypothetical protein [Acinetobacter pittii]